MSVYNFNREVISSGSGADASDIPVRIRVLHWNIGHFGAGTSSNSRIVSANANAVAMKYKTLFNDIAPDIIGINEYEEAFTNDGGELASEYVFSAFKQQIIDATPYDTSWGCNALFMNGFTIIDKFSAKLVTTERNRWESGTALYRGVILNIRNKSVYVIEAHLSSENDGNRPIEINNLIKGFGNKDYVIMMGDFNVSRKEEFNEFKNAGFTLASGGYVGYLGTAPRYDVALDNIILKGFEPIDIHVCRDAMAITNGADNTTGTQLHATDHIPIYADLVML